MDYRRARPGEFVMHVKTRDIGYVRYTWDDGTVVVYEAMPLFSDSPELILWEIEEYVVLGEIDPEVLNRIKKRKREQWPSRFFNYSLTTL